MKLERQTVYALAIRMLLSCFSLFLFVPTRCYAETASCDAFKREVEAIYNFKPSRLPDAEKRTKSNALDTVWNAVKADPQEYLPCLRSLLNDPQADPFFRFDAGKLLVEQDPSPASKTTLLGGLAVVDLADVPLQQWVQSVAWLGAQGFDVSVHGERWLQYADAHYDLPEHGGITVDRCYGALFIYGSMDEQVATPALTKIAAQKGHVGRDCAVWILAAQATPEALRAIAHLDTEGISPKFLPQITVARTTAPPLTARVPPKVSRDEFIKTLTAYAGGDREPFRKVIQRVPDNEQDAVAVLKPEDLALVRKVRRLRIADANQHAYEDYVSFTIILLKMVWKPELVS